MLFLIKNLRNWSFGILILFQFLPSGISLRDELTSQTTLQQFDNIRCWEEEDSKNIFLYSNNGTFGTELQAMRSNNLTILRIIKVDEIFQCRDIKPKKIKNLTFKWLISLFLFYLQFTVKLKGLYFCFSGAKTRNNLSCFVQICEGFKK